MNILWSHIEVATKPQQIWLIGDLDGKFSNLEKHLRSLWVIPERKIGSILRWDQELVWTGGNTHIIISGDILADRYMEGFNIMESLRKIRIQAQEKWWNIEVLVGNHDDRMIGFLMGKWWEYITDEIRWSLDRSTGKKDHIGMDELLNFWKNRTEILQNMRNDPRWRMLLDEICMMNIFVKKWNALHFHTPPSKLMLDILYAKYNTKSRNLLSVIESINTNWKNTLRTGFFDPKREWYDKLKIHYSILASAFLHPLNGTEDNMRERLKKGNIDLYTQNITPSNHPFYTVLSEECGIDTIYHGHTERIPEVEGINFVGINRKAIYMLPETSTHILRDSTSWKVAAILE